MQPVNGGDVTHVIYMLHNPPPPATPPPKLHPKSVRCGAIAHGDLLCFISTPVQKLVIKLSIIKVIFKDPKQI